MLKPNIDLLNGLIFNEWLELTIIVGIDIPSPINKITFFAIFLFILSNSSRCCSIDKLFAYQKSFCDSSVGPLARSAPGRFHWGIGLFGGSLFFAYNLWKTNKRFISNQYLHIFSLKIIKLSIILNVLCLIYHLLLEHNLHACYNTYRR